MVVKGIDSINKKENMDGERTWERERERERLWERKEKEEQSRYIYHRSNPLNFR